MSRNDVNANDWLISASLAATGNLVTSTGTQFRTMGLLGYNGFSLTVQTLAGSTAVGTIFVQCTDIIGPSEHDPNVPWVNMNYPNTSTPVSIVISSGANSYNVQVWGVATKIIRLNYQRTSGTGNLNAGITCRANSR